MATFVHRLLPRAPDDESPVAIRLVSSPQARASAPTPLDARDADRNSQIWNARLVLATTGLHLAQFRHKNRPLANAGDYAELFIYDEAQQESALSDAAILGALPRKCLLLRLGDPKQTSGGTAPGDLAKEVRRVSDHLALGIRSSRQPFLPQALPQLIQSLLIDDVPSVPSPSALLQLGGHTGDPSIDGYPASEAPGATMSGRAPLAQALLHAVDDLPLRWHVANDIDACAGESPPHNWCVMLPLSASTAGGL